jgi:hydrogenase maturation protease
MTIRVLGLGNVLMGDDGFGPYVVRQLDALYDCPDDVEIVDVGTPGLDLMPFLLGAGAVVFVDTVKSGGAPGEIRRYGRDAILRHAPLPRLSPHDPGVKASLLTLEFAGAGPAHASLVGVVPKSVDVGPGLSDEVRAAVPGVIGAIVEELTALGAPPRLRAAALPAGVWWEAGSVGESDAAS